MDTPAWDVPTPDAKDLVRRMLTLDPQQRINMKEILNHPWLAPPSTASQSQCPRVGSGINMGADYRTRIKSLVFRNKLKRYFISNNIEAGLLSNSKEAAAFYFAAFDQDRDGFVGLDAMVSERVSQVVCQLDIC